MAIFLDEAFTTEKKSSATAYLNNLSKTMKINESLYEKHFNHEAAGMEICFESEVAWNQLMHEMQVNEYKSLHEGLLGTIWEKIKEWASKIKAFFVKIWQSIKAWVKNIWQKITGTTDEDLIKKLGELASYIKEGEDVEVYEVNAVEAVVKAKAACSGAFAEANKRLLGASSTKDDEAFEEAKSKALEKFDEEQEKLRDVEPTEKSFKSAEAISALKAYPANIKELVKFIESSDKYIAGGTKAADKAAAEAQKADKLQGTKNAKNLEKFADKKNSSVSQADLDKGESEKKKTEKAVRNAVAVANFCRMLCQKGISMAQLAKSRLDANHESARAVAKKLIKQGLKNKKEKES